MFFNSTVFDPDGENHEAYKEIHNKYKEMVVKAFFIELTSFYSNHRSIEFLN